MLNAGGWIQALACISVKCCRGFEKCVDARRQWLAAALPATPRRAQLGSIRPIHAVKIGESPSRRSAEHGVVRRLAIDNEVVETRPARFRLVPTATAELMIVMNGIMLLVTVPAAGLPIQPIRRCGIFGYLLVFDDGVMAAGALQAPMPASLLDAPAVRRRKPQTW